MSKFTAGEWEYFASSLIGLSDDQKANWYLIGSPDGAVGFIRHESDARLIAAVPEMYALLNVWVKIQDEPTLMNAKERAEELLARIDGKEATHEGSK